MKKGISEDHAEVCKAFAHSKRLDILNILEKDELTASEITQELGTLKANTSQHLSIMRTRGILNVRRDGTNSYYSYGQY